MHSCSPKIKLLTDGWLRIFFVLLLIGCIIATTYPVFAQVEMISLNADSILGEDIIFSGKFKGGILIREARLFYQIEGNSSTQSEEATILPGGEIEYQLSSLDYPIRVFSDIEYWFELTLSNGDVFESPHAVHVYTDNRFDWQSAEDPQFRVHWYQGDTAFVQSLLEVAGLGLSNAQMILPYELKEPVSIYAYARASELREALQSLGSKWTGAHTSPDLNVMLLSLPDGPEQRLEMERQIPHEMMHILIYQNIGDGYINIPHWLNEGLGSVAELYPNPDYIILLENAIEKDALPPIQAYCEGFPDDASGVFLAYAQSASFTRFLHEQYGSSGLDQLIRQYADGVECERGVEIALGSTLSQLDRKWRQESLGEDIYQTAFVNLMPWFVILLIILVVPMSLILIGRSNRSAVRQNKSVVR